MLHILLRTLKHIPVRVGYSLLQAQKRIPLRVSLQYSKEITTRYESASETRKIAWMFRNLEKDVNLGHIYLKDLENVLLKVKKSDSLTVTQSLTLIRCCGTLLIQEKPEDRIKLVHQIWETGKNLGPGFDISHYNMLLKVYLENDYNFSPSDILNELVEGKIQPNYITYERIMMHHCQKGNVAEALDTLAIMREKGMMLSPNVYHALIIGYSRIKDMKNAESIVNGLTEIGILPSSETYSLLMSGYIRQGDLKRANEILEDCKQRGIGLMDTDAFTIIYEYATNNYEYEVDKILKMIWKSNQYNVRIAHFSLQLIAAGQPRVAFKIIATTNFTGVHFPKGRTIDYLFIVQLVRCDMPTDVILKCCFELMSMNVNPLALDIAMSYSLRYGKTKIALELFNVAKQKKLPIRMHYFWPLLIAEAKRENVRGVFDILSAMHKNFDLTADAATIIHYLVPHLLKQNIDVESHLTEFKSCGVPVGVVANSLVYCFMNNGQFEKALEVAKKYRVSYPLHRFRNRLVTSFRETGDTVLFAKLLKQMSAGIHQQANYFNANKHKSDVAPQNPQNFVDSIVKKGVETLAKENNVKLLVKLSQDLSENEVVISTKMAEEIKEIMQSIDREGILFDDPNHEPSVQLEKLPAKQYSYPIVESKSTEIPVTKLDLNVLERLCERIETEGECVNEIKKYLFCLYARDKQYDKLFKIKKELEANKVALSVGMYAHLINAYTEENKLDEAESLYQSLRGDFNFTLDTVKLLRLALMFVQNEQYDKAFELLEHEVHITNIPAQENESVSLYRNILDFFAAKGDVENVGKFFNLLSSRQLVPVKNSLLGPLIKVHLQRDDIESAVNEFEHCAKKYHSTPMRHKLTLVCVQKKCWDSLEKVTNIISATHGDVSSLYDLLTVFIDCGEMDRAKILLRLPVLLHADIGKKRFERIIRRCHFEGSFERLQNILTLTNGTDLLDRSELYFKMLCVCSKFGDVDQAMALWKQLQEEDLLPSDKFCYLLASILNKRKMPIPFKVPRQTCDVFGDGSRKIKLNSSLRQLINSGNIEQALEFSKKCAPAELNTADLSLLIDDCLKKDRYSDAKELFKLHNYRFGELPNHALMANLFDVAAKARDVDFLKYCESFFSAEWKQTLSLQDYLAKAYLNAQRAEEYLSELENTTDGAKPGNEFASFMRTFPRRGIIDILFAEPKLYLKIKEMVEKCTNKGDRSRIGQNLLWTYLMLEKRFNEADEIWEKHFQNRTTVIDLKAILEHVVKNSDIELATKLMIQLEARTNVNTAVLGVAYGTLISAYIQNNAIHDALRILDHALTNITVNEISVFSLYTLKAVCKVKNIRFPHEILAMKHKFVQKNDRVSLV